MFQIDQQKIEQLLLAGLREELNSAMRSQWGTGQKLRNMVDDVIGKNTAAIEKQIKIAVLEAIQSDEFVQMARDVMLGAMKSKFSGAFEGVMRAAGKRAAQDEVLAGKVAERMTAI